MLPCFVCSQLSFVYFRKGAEGYTTELLVLFSNLELRNKCVTCEELKCYFQKKSGLLSGVIQPTALNFWELTISTFFEKTKQNLKKKISELEVITN